MKYYLYSVCKVTNYILNDWHFTTKKCKKPSVSAIFMLQEPAMCQKVIHEQSRYRDGNTSVDQRVASIIEQAIA
jgi:hypothetical protein